MCQVAPPSNANSAIVVQTEQKLWKLQAEQIWWDQRTTGSYLIFLNPKNHFKVNFTVNWNLISKKTISASENLIVTFYKTVVGFFQRIFLAAPVDDK